MIHFFQEWRTIKSYEFFKKGLEDLAMVSHNNLLVVKNNRSTSLNDYERGTSSAFMDNHIKL